MLKSSGGQEKTVKDGKKTKNRINHRIYTVHFENSDEMERYETNV